MEKIIFLDWDEVIGSPHTEKLGLPVSPIAVKGINLIGREVSDDQHKVNIVWSATMRKFFDNRVAASRFMQFTGFAVKLHADYRTPPGNTNRGQQIQQWLDAHPEVTSYVIIDDSNDMEEHQLSRFVQVDPINCLTIRDIYKAIEILKAN